MEKAIEQGSANTPLMFSYRKAVTFSGLAFYGAVLSSLFLFGPKADNPLWIIVIILFTAKYFSGEIPLPFAKRSAPVTIDDTALSFRKITIPWTKIHAAEEKSGGLGPMQWRKLVLTGSFYIPHWGERIVIPLSQIDGAETLKREILKRVETVTAEDIKELARKRFHTTGEKLYKGIHFTSEGISTSDEYIPWPRVIALKAQENVVMRLGSMNLRFLTADHSERELTIPEENSAQYQSVVAFSIVHAASAEIDPDVMKILKKSTDSVRNSYRLTMLSLLIIVQLCACLMVLIPYRFDPVITTAAAISIFFCLYLLTNNSVDSRGEIIPPAQNRIRTWGSILAPVLIMLLAIALSPGSRHWIMGDITATFGSADTAEEHYREALRISDNNFEIMFDMGILYMNRGEWKKAFEHIDPAIRHDINFWAHKEVLLAPDMLLLMGRKEEAVRWCEAALEVPDLSGITRAVLSDRLEEIQSGNI